MISAITEHISLTDRSGEVLIPAMKRAGIKPTSSRIHVLQVLNDHPQSAHRADDIYRHLLAQGCPHNLSSIAHALTDLERGGLVERVCTDGRRNAFRVLPPPPAQGGWQLVMRQADGSSVSVTDASLIDRLVQVLTGFGWIADEPRRVRLQIDLAPDCSAGTCLPTGSDEPPLRRAVDTVGDASENPRYPRC